MAALGDFPGRPDLAVAVSGGPDSLALALLAQRWAAAQGGQLLALTVDHRLRPDSAREAAQVKRWLSAHGIQHRTLRWLGAKPKANLAAAAREARYALLIAACRRARIGALALAHHREDQAETFLLRLGRGSGVDGLAAMAPLSERDGIALLRPLLDVARDRLRALLTARGQAWIEDPSNADPTRARTRVRALLPALAAASVPPGRIAATAARMRRVRVALAHATAELLAAAFSFNAAGGCQIDRARLAAAPEEIALRALDQALRNVGGRELPPRLERLERTLTAILAPGFRPRTYSSCRLSEQRGNIRIEREDRPRRRRGVAPP
jgi:tRNA(Ile)-lysidine synthase